MKDPVNTGRIPFGHGAIGHNHSQRSVPRCFSLFKRCEWLVSNWTVSIWTSFHHQSY